VVSGVLLAVALIVVGIIFLVRRHNANKSTSSRQNDSYLALNDDIDDSTVSRDGGMDTTRSTFDGRSSDFK
jgi:cbb3-type cytochrome oxidase subunit 3